MTTSKITLLGIYSRLKRMIADIKNMPLSDVKAEQTLRNDLHFTEAGVRALSPHIKGVFSFVDVHMTPDEVAKAKTVRDLAKAIWQKVPDTYKAKKEDNSP